MSRKLQGAGGVRLSHGASLKATTSSFTPTALSAQIWTPANNIALNSILAPVGRFSPSKTTLNPCKHIQILRRKIELIGKVLLAEIDKLSVALAAVFTFAGAAVPAVEWEWEPVLIDKAECPKGFWLQKTSNYQLTEYAVLCEEKTSSGLKVRSIGKISETVDKDAISAMTPRDLNGRLFPSLVDAVNFLAKYSGVKAASQLALV